MLIITIGCESDDASETIDNCTDGLLATQSLAKLEAYTQALGQYSEDPSTANCNTIKTAAKTYIDTIEELYDCVPMASRAELDVNIANAKAEINEESCD